MDLKKYKKPTDKQILAEEAKQEKPKKKERLTASILVKFPPTEKFILEELSDDAGLKLSPFIRTIVKKYLKENGHI